MLDRFYVMETVAAAAEAESHRMATLEGRDAGDAVPGCGPADQRAVSPGSTAMGSVDDDVDQTVLDETHWVPRSFPDLVNVTGRDPGGLESFRGPCLLYTSPSPRDRTRS